MTKRTRLLLWGFLVVVVSVVTLFVIAVGSFYRRGRQVRTFADMRIIAAKLDAAIRTGVPTRAELLAVVQSVNHGRDAWGRDYLFELRATSLGTEYVLISRGSDGKLDFSDVSDYFTLAEGDVSYHFARDIVFRNGTAVTGAGK